MIDNETIKSIRDRAERFAKDDAREDLDYEKWGEAMAVWEVIALLDEVDRLTTALTKISAIRDSIVGKQGFNFSEHAYPLVAVLNEAGFKGAGYEIASKNLGTLIEQRDKAEKDLAEQRAENTRLMSILGLSMSSTAAERLERLERLEPLRTVLRSWDLQALLRDQRIPDEAVLPLLRTFAHVEAAENAAAKAKEGDRG